MARELGAWPGWSGRGAYGEESAEVASRVVEGWGEDRQTCHASAGYRVSTAKCKGSYIIDLSLIL